MCNFHKMNKTVRVTQTHNQTKGIGKDFWFELVHLCFENVYKNQVQPIQICTNKVKSSPDSYTFNLYLVVIPIYFL